MQAFFAQSINFCMKKICIYPRFDAKARFWACKLGFAGVSWHKLRYSARSYGIQFSVSHFFFFFEPHFVKPLSVSIGQVRDSCSIADRGVVFRRHLVRLSVVKEFRLQLICIHAICDRIEQQIYGMISANGIFCPIHVLLEFFR